MTTRPAAAPRLRDLELLRRVRDQIDREYAEPLDVEALARGARAPQGERPGPIRYEEVLHDG